MEPINRLPFSNDGTKYCLKNEPIIKIEPINRWADYPVSTVLVHAVKTILFLQTKFNMGNSGTCPECGNHMKSTLLVHYLFTHKKIEELTNAEVCGVTRFVIFSDQIFSDQINWSLISYLVTF